MSYHVAMGLIPTRGRLSSVLTSQQETMSGLNRGVHTVMSVHRDSLFNNTWGNRPTLINPKTALRWASQNVRGIIPKYKDPKLAAGIENLIKLQAGIVGLTETNAEWDHYSYQEQYDKAYHPMMMASRHSFSSSSDIDE
jgi:hypothetical protein